MPAPLSSWSCERGERLKLMCSQIETTGFEISSILESFIDYVLHSMLVRRLIGYLFASSMVIVS